MTLHGAHEGQGRVDVIGVVRQRLRDALPHGLEPGEVDDGVDLVRGEERLGLVPIAQVEGVHLQRLTGQRFDPRHHGGLGVNKGVDDDDFVPCGRPHGRATAHRVGLDTGATQEVGGLQAAVAALADHMHGQAFAQLVHMLGQSAQGHQLGRGHMPGAVFHGLANIDHPHAAVSQAGRQVSDRDLTGLVEQRPLGRDLRMDLGHVERLDGVDDLLE